MYFGWPDRVELANGFYAIKYNHSNACEWILMKDMVEYYRDKKLVKLREFLEIRERWRQNDRHNPI